MHYLAERLPIRYAEYKTTQSLRRAIRERVSRIVSEIYGAGRPEEMPDDFYLKEEARYSELHELEERLRRELRVNGRLLPKKLFKQLELSSFHKFEPEIRKHLRLLNDVSLGELVDHLTRGIRKYQMYEFRSHCSDEIARLPVTTCNPEDFYRTKGF
ncbi:MAG TPA: hypothetical protein VJC07_02325 [Candidatus Nanoarchaeia archaeon]|nr:hypothetical protein [Candidatus Nanoarchaeia archaeon]